MNNNVHSRAFQHQRWLGQIKTLEAIFDSISARAWWRYIQDDDVADRFAHCYTVRILVFLAWILVTKHYVTAYSLSGPIQCWCPAHFNRDQEEYVNSHCWAQNTFHRPADDSGDIPREEKRNKIMYYQWIPILLLVQAFLFYLPRMLWKGVSGNLGFNIGDITKNCDLLFSPEMSDQHDSIIAGMTDQLDRVLTIIGSFDREGIRQPSRQPVNTLAHRAMNIFSNRHFYWCCRRILNSIFKAYLLVKVLSLANILIQLTLLNCVFLGLVPRLYGVEAIRAVIAGRKTTEMSYFPLVTLCDVQLRRLGNVHTYTVECVLTINWFNEMCFVFLWIWFAFVAGLQLVSLIRWIGQQTFKTSRRRYIKKHIRCGHPKEKNYNKINAFCDFYLKSDGIFILRLAGHNTNEFSITYVVCSLWDKYNNRGMTTEVEAANALEQNVAVV